MDPVEIIVESLIADASHAVGNCDGCQSAAAMESKKFETEIDLGIISFHKDGKDIKDG